MPHILNDDIGKIIFTEATVSLANTNYTDIYIQARQNEMIAENNAESAKISKAAEATRKERERQSGYTGMGREYFMAPNNKSTGANTGAVVFGRTLHYNKPAGLNNAAVSSYIFTTTHGKLPLNINN